MPKQFTDTAPLDLDDPKYEKHDPVLAQIYNMTANRSGEVFVICRRHYAELEERLGQKAPDYFLSIVALMPVRQECSRCEDEADAEETR